jgi:hypothetical protein
METRLLYIYRALNTLQYSAVQELHIYVTLVRSDAEACVIIRR